MRELQGIEEADVRPGEPGLPFPVGLPNIPDPPLELQIRVVRERRVLRLPARTALHDRPGLDRPVDPGPIALDPMRGIRAHPVELGEAQADPGRRARPGGSRHRHQQDQGQVAELGSNHHGEEEGQRTRISRIGPVDVERSRRG